MVSTGWKTVLGVAMVAVSVSVSMAQGSEYERRSLRSTISPEQARDIKEMIQEAKQSAVDAGINPATHDDMKFESLKRPGWGRKDVNLKRPGWGRKDVNMENEGYEKEDLNMENYGYLDMESEKHGKSKNRKPGARDKYLARSGGERTGERSSGGHSNGRGVGRDRYRRTTGHKKRKGKKSKYV